METHGSDHRYSATQAVRVAWMETKLGRLATARERIEGAMAVRAAAPDAEPRMIADDAIAYAEVLRRLGDNERALHFNPKVIEIGERIEHDEIRLYGLIAKGEDLRRLGRNEEAIEALERGLSLGETIEASANDLGSTRVALSRALDETGHDPSRVRRLAEQAIVLYSDLPEFAKELAEARAWLAGLDSGRAAAGPG